MFVPMNRACKTACHAGIFLWQKVTGLKQNFFLDCFGFKFVVGS